ncbi:endo-1,4-beta-xylanase [Micromonospora sp. NPDC048930]|uniref:endo-1,4-beta-xylanase n=1 Tax=Micromonospora sp. NPDC048930 TaxID=3364261 RepID=UPI0037211F83
MRRSTIRRLPVVLLLLPLLAIFTPTPAQAGIATGPKFLGNVINGGTAPATFTTYWNQVTPENDGKWGVVEATRGTMNWANLDAIYDYAGTNNLPVRFHTLVWGQQQPAWLSALPAADQQAEVTDWIAQAGARYGSRTAFVDVVNEPLHNPPAYAAAIGGTGSTGWDWVIWSFAQARAAFPNAKLQLNEYGIINDPNATGKYVQLANLLKARGLIDSIGIQCHYFNLERASVSTMRTVLDQLATTGLPIYVTELDLTGTDNTQLSKYQDKFPVLWTHPAVAGVTLWGYEYGKTWSNRAELLHADGTERPALQWLKTYVAATG